MDKESTISIVRQDGCKVMLVTNGNCLETVLMCIEQAIRGSGFNPKGQLDFVEED
jgi:fructose-1,6-bisphosphatase/sedoheptulose 1,7-bisphosphatase-like protein